VQDLAKCVAGIKSLQMLVRLLSSMPKLIFWTNYIGDRILQLFFGLIYIPLVYTFLMSHTYNKFEVASICFILSMVLSWQKGLNTKIASEGSYVYFCIKNPIGSDLNMYEYVC
jgi:membrane-associated HD superfamily phosphohydrolase